MEFIKFVKLHKEIMEAITCLRLNNCGFTNKTIDFMKKASLDKLKNMESIDRIKTKTKARILNQHYSHLLKF